MSNNLQDIDTYRIFVSVKQTNTLILTDMSTATKIDSIYISNNIEMFTRIATVTEAEILLEDGSNPEGSVMVELFQLNETERFFTRVYETDEVEEHSDLATAQKQAFELAYAYLTTEA